MPKVTPPLSFTSLFYHRIPKKQQFIGCLGKFSLDKQEGTAVSRRIPSRKHRALGKTADCVSAPSGGHVLRLKRHKIDVPHPLQTYKNQDGFANAYSKAAHRFIRMFPPVAPHRPAHLAPAPLLGPSGSRPPGVPAAGCSGGRVPPGLRRAAALGRAPVRGLIPSCPSSLPSPSAFCRAFVPGALALVPKSKPWRRQVPPPREQGGVCPCFEKLF